MTSQDTAPYLDFKVELLYEVGGTKGTSYGLDDVSMLNPNGFTYLDGEKTGTYWQEITVEKDKIVVIDAEKSTYSTNYLTETYVFEPQK